MEKREKEINELYELCGLSLNREYPIVEGINTGNLNNQLHTDRDAFTRNSVFSYAACGASSVGYNWLSENGFKFL